MPIANVHVVLSSLCALPTLISDSNIVLTVQVVVAYGSAYLAFLWIYYGITGSWVYRALDWTKFKAVPYYFALPALLLLGFAVM